MSDITQANQSTGQQIIDLQRIFLTDVDPEDDARPGDKWQNSSDEVKIRKYDASDWITVT